MPIRQTSLIEVRNTRSKGRGIFATAFIPKGTIFEQAPVLVMPARELDVDQEDTVLSHYTFAWGKNTVAVALGFGSLYNHSYSPNACYEDVRGQLKNYIAIRDIQIGEEVTINYNGDADSREPVWFDVVESTPEGPSGVRKAKAAAVSGSGSNKKVATPARRQKPGSVARKQIQKKGSKLKA